MALARVIIGRSFVMLSLAVFFGLGRGGVLLVNHLTNGAASFGDTVNFTCKTTGSNTLAWRSREYIGQNGEQLSLSPLGTTSSLNSYAVATVTNTSVENGRRVLESNLTIIVQGNIQTASITCISLGTGELDVTSFNLTKNPTVVCGSPMVCPGDVRTFVCETRDSTSLRWESTEYIGGVPISFTPLSPLGHPVKSGINPAVSANLMMNYEINGVRVLMSQLNVTVSEDILSDPQHDITCVNVGLSRNEVHTLRMALDGCSSTTESGTTQSGSTGTGPSEISDSRNLDERSIVLYIIPAVVVVVVVVICIAVSASAVLVRTCIIKRSIHSSVKCEQSLEREVECTVSRYMESLEIEDECIDNQLGKKSYIGVGEKSHIGEISHIGAGEKSCFVAGEKSFVA